MVQQMLAVIGTEVGVHFLGPLDHHVALDHPSVTFPQNGENLVGAVADGDLGGQEIFDKLIAKFPDFPRVFRVDQCREPLIADLPFEMSCRIQSIHFTILSLPLLRKHAPYQHGKEENHAFMGFTICTLKIHIEKATSNLLIYRLGLIYEYSIKHYSCKAFEVF